LREQKTDCCKKIAEEILRWYFESINFKDFYICNEYSLLTIQTFKN
jgi:hypothetical protein